MKREELDVSYWEDVWEAVSIPLEKRAEDIHEIHGVLTRILPMGKLELIEIGCAPGSWLAYFHKCFGYCVSGIERAPRACEKTIENLRTQNIRGEIFHGDFFEFTHEPYDVVFSAGFVEHFKDVASVIQRIADLCAPKGGLVITMVPSMEGINRWISTTFRPHVAAGHFPINREELKEYHERCGLETLYCDYVGSLHILTPVAKNRFSEEHPSASALLNLPFRAWNRAVSVATRRIGRYPRVRFLTESIIYVGER
jgi:cyclopropane fatty-acyl-phospholipid synthase-like methyltransferase